MIKGIGIDIVEVNRMEKWLLNAGLLERYFHPEEIKAAANRERGAALFFAARFAGKEAFGKALGTGLRNLNLKDILILNSDNGKPEIFLSGTAAEALKKNGAGKAHISLTHEKNNAAAIVILED